MAGVFLKSKLDTREDTVAERCLVVLNEDKFERSHLAYVISNDGKLFQYKKIFKLG